MSDDREKAYESMRSLIEQAESSDPDYGLTWESPLDIGISGKYVNVLFSTGGPHTEMLVEYDDDDAATYYFENEPVWALFTRMDWGTRDDITMSRHDATAIMRAIQRDPDELGEEEGDD